MVPLQDSTSLGPLKALQAELSRQPQDGSLCTQQGASYSWQVSAVLCSCIHRSRAFSGTRAEILLQTD